MKKMLPDVPFKKIRWGILIPKCDDCKYVSTKGETYETWLGHNNLSKKGSGAERWNKEFLTCAKVSLLYIFSLKGKRRGWCLKSLCL